MRTSSPLVAMCIGAVLTGTSGWALAQDGWYAGFFLGSSNADLSPSVVAVTGATSTNLVKDERDPGVTALVGYRFNRYFAAEVGFAWLGEFQMTNQVTAPTVGALNADIRTIGIFIDAVGLLPLGANFDALAKVGVVGAETRTFRSTSGTVTPAPGTLTNASTDEAVLKVGLGIQYNFAKGVTLRAEWDRYLNVGDGNTGQFDIDLYSLGVLFRF